MYLGYYWIKFYCRLLHVNGEKTSEKINNFFRKNGMTVGEKCRIYSNILSSEPYLISIGDNVTISNDVQFLTHDNSVIKVLPQSTDLFGKIEIGNNCFIGARAILLPGIKIGDNCIVGSGSVVTKSVMPNMIVAGNPAKVIANVEDFSFKVKDKVFNIKNLNSLEKQRKILNNKEKWLEK